MRFEQVPEREEVLSRFIFSRSQFSETQGRVKPAAFLPTRNPPETSVFRSEGLVNADIRQMGALVGEPSDRTLKAWGNVLTGVVFDVGLDLRPDNIPERHAAIIGWPEHKDEQISLAQRLAEAATLHRPA